MIEYYKKVVFENYTNFTGRARRAEYWYYVLASVIIAIVLAIIDGVFGLEFGGQLKLGILGMVYSLAVLIPGLAVVVRRLHDVGKSGWYYFIVLIPIAGIIWLLVLLCTEGEPTENRYGENPKKIDQDFSTSFS
ncbi:MAG: uncharacterized membrane protein YhaH (DUF805 family) [Flavobacterium sp.]|jgi:uncharacterized membrane protein YhaH (DUF805 family)